MNLLLQYVCVKRFFWLEFENDEVRAEDEARDEKIFHFGARNKLQFKEARNVTV